MSTSLTPDSIEFDCTSCRRKLKVPISAAGRQAKCPQCQSLVMVPTPPAAVNPGPTAPMPPASPAPPQPLAGVPVQPPHQPQPLQPHPGQPHPGPPPAQTFAPQPLMPSAVAPVGSPLPGPPQATPMPAAPQAPAAEDMRLGADLLHQGGEETPTRALFNRITDQISKIYVGQEELVLGTLVALFSSGHVLIESVPGLGKTLFVRTLGQVLGCDFGRIQFTADLMPSDITGAPIFDMKEQEFRFRPGPVFTQLLLADEINRSPAKTHAALLEIMQEYRVTIDGVSHPIKRPFLVMATQNPIESEGTYNLPEAQLDRFMFKLVADYPAENEEANILRLHSRQDDINARLEEEVETVTSPDEILKVTRENSEVRVDERLIDYINKVVRQTRQWPQVHMGASPRAGIALMQGARTLAAFGGRDYAVPDDVVQIALQALRHRVILTAEAEVEGHSVDQVLTEMIRSVEVPRL